MKPNLIRNSHVGSSAVFYNGSGFEQLPCSAIANIFPNLKFRLHPGRASGNSTAKERDNSPEAASITCLPFSKAVDNRAIRSVIALARINQVRELVMQGS